MNFNCTLAFVVYYLYSQAHSKVASHKVLALTVIVDKPH